MSSAIEFRLTQMAHAASVIRRAIEHPSGWSMDLGEGTPEAEAQVKVEGEAISFSSDFEDLTGELSTLRLHHDGVLMAVKPFSLIESSGLSVRIEWRWSVGQSERV